MRAGTYVKQPNDFRAFIPADLPPDPPIEMDPEITKLLSDADRALGRLERICFVCGGFSPVSPGIHDAPNARRLSDTD